MKKQLTFGVLIACIMCAVFYLFVSNRYVEAPNSDENIPEQNIVAIEEGSSEIEENSSKIVWTRKQNQPDGNDLPTYNLTLSINDSSYEISDYFKEDLYGCRDSSVRIRPEGTEAPENSLSDELCYVMASGNLFYVVKTGSEYQVVHKEVGDVLDEEKMKPKILFTVK